VVLPAVRFFDLPPHEIHMQPQVVKLIRVSERHLHLRDLVFYAVEFGLKRLTFCDDSFFFQGQVKPMKILVPADNLAADPLPQRGRYSLEQRNQNHDERQDENLEPIDQRSNPKR